MSKVKNAELLLNGEAPEAGAGVFGCVIEPADSELILLPVPWDVTASYGRGAMTGPTGIWNASYQLDLEDLCFGRPYLKGIAMLPIDEAMLKLNTEASEVMDKIRAGDADVRLVEAINAKSEIVNRYVYEQAKQWLQQGRKIGVIGGDHSCPYGYFKALSEVHGEFSILHVDAHLDLRLAYEGFTWSHASIMRNAMDRLPNIKHLCQIGIRDFSFPEKTYAESLQGRNSVFYGRDLFRRKARGERFADTVAEMLSKVAGKVYISFDIDGLDPAYCSSTGTPVPGGVSFDEAIYIIEEVGMSKNHQVIGFDLCEVVDNSAVTEYDCNVAARILYKLCGAILRD